MKIIIAGAGQVGVGLAKYLRAENNEIVLVDSDCERLGNLSEQLDIQTIEGSAAYPAILEKAGAEHADVFLAVTGSDETNIVSCGVARSVFNIPTRIARIMASEYLSQKYKSFLQSQSIDVVLSPEMETARRVLENLSVAHSVDFVSLADGRAKLIGIRCRKSSPIFNKTLSDIEKMTEGFNVRVVAFKHRQQLIPLNDTVLRAGDDVYFVVDANHLQPVLDIFGYEMIEPKYMVIFGGGKVGYQLAKLLEQTSYAENITLVEAREDRARYLAEKLESTLVIHGNGLDDKLVEDLNLSNYQVAIATTQTDESNILLSLLAKRNGVARTCALTHNPLYDDLLIGMGVDITIEPNAVLVSAILQHLRKGRVKADYFLQSGIGEVLEMEALETSKITHTQLGKLKIPQGVVIAGIVRGDTFLLPTSGLVVQNGDTVILFAERGKVREAEKLFTVGFSFF